MVNLETEFVILRNPGDSSCTATIQKTGRLGFSAATIKLMGINEKNYIKIAKKPGDSNSENFYLIILAESDKDSFKVVKAGTYFYLNTGELFDQLKFDYQNQTYRYKVTKYDEERKIFQLSKKQPSRYSHKKKE